MAAAARLLDAACGDELSGEGSRSITSWVRSGAAASASGGAGMRRRRRTRGAAPSSEMAALDDERHLPELRKRERERRGSDNAKREGFSLGAHRWRRRRGKDVAAMTSQLEVMA
uniref:Uncharacterized protein n=1 Tax=Oryza meridionalis TaxID=40149 RepID=A0A0E0F5U8_9ORYZ